MNDAATRTCLLVTWSIDRIIQIRARRTVGVAVMRALFLHLYCWCLTCITKTIHAHPCFQCVWLAKTSTTHCRCTCWPMAITKLVCTLPTSQVGSAQPTSLVRDYFCCCQGLLYVRGLFFVRDYFLSGTTIFCWSGTQCTDVAPLLSVLPQLLFGKAPCWTSKRCTVGQRCI